VIDLPVPLGLAFVAGLASFLSPCVLPLVPSYMTFVTGTSIDELRGETAWRGRVHTVVRAGAFIIGFMLVFLTLGASATVAGLWMRRALPVLQQVGGAIIVLFGLILAGWVRVPALMREGRVHIASRPASLGGTMLVGVAFGAGWTPCVGPVLASILLYAGGTSTLAEGMMLLTAYGVGLGIPFFVTAVAFNWYLAGAARLRRWARPIELAAGMLMIVMGTLLATGHFARLTRLLADFGQLVTIER
jgi:cytochrome c-type biogenesis protein